MDAAALPGGDPAIADRTASDLDRRSRWLDRIALGLLGAGVLAVATGVLPGSEAEATVRRILPLLVFLGAVVVLADLTATAGVFDVVAARVAIVARGSYLRLFLLTTLLVSVTTILLNLDTTAILLTPVMLSLAGKTGIKPLPLAMTTVWLANTASLLLPISNLTNLLAADRIGLTSGSFARHMAAAQVGTIAVTLILLWAFYWRRRQRGAARYQPGSRHRPSDPALCALATVACGLFLVGVLLELPLGGVAAVSAGLLLVGFTRRDRSALGLRLIPWRLLVFVTGMFLVVQALGAHGLDQAAADALGDPGGVTGTYRVAVVGAGFSNAVNNLPAYVAAEGAMADAGPDRLLALLVGTNAGPIITPWGSLATLLWYERCLAYDVSIDLRRYIMTSACLALACVTVAVPLLRLTS